MINPVSNESAVHVQPTQSSNAPAATVAPAPATKTEDTVKLSDHAKASVSGGDIDHDGDSH